MAESLGLSALMADIPLPEGETAVLQWCIQNNLTNSYTKFVELGFAKSIEHLKVMISYTKQLDSPADISDKFGITLADALILKNASNNTDETSGTSDAGEGGLQLRVESPLDLGASFGEVSSSGTSSSTSTDIPTGSPAIGVEDTSAAGSYEISITKQPCPQRFRYSSERDQHNKSEDRKSKTTGSWSHSKKESDLEIQVKNAGSDYSGAIQVTAYLVKCETDLEEPGTYTPHPHSLDGPHCSDGYYRDRQLGPSIRIPHLQIVRCKCNELGKNLQLWQQRGLDPNDKLTNLLTFSKSALKEEFNLDVVRLCVRLDFLSPDGSSIECRHVWSHPINDSPKVNIDLRELTVTEARVDTKSETVMLGHHFKTGDTAMFYEECDGKIVWEAEADIHDRSYVPNALKVITPHYTGPSTASRFPVQVRIKRLQNGRKIAESKPLKFLYHRDDYGLSAKIAKECVKIPRGYVDEMKEACSSNGTAEAPKHQPCNSRANIINRLKQKVGSKTPGTSQTETGSRSENCHGHTLDLTTGEDEISTIVDRCPGTPEPRTCYQPLTASVDQGANRADGGFHHSKNQQVHVGNSLTETPRTGNCVKAYNMGAVQRQLSFDTQAQSDISPPCRMEWDEHTELSGSPVSHNSNSPLRTPCRSQNNNIPLSCPLGTPSSCNESMLFKDVFMGPSDSSCS